MATPRPGPGVCWWKVEAAPRAAADRGRKGIEETQGRSPTTAVPSWGLRRLSPREVGLRADVQRPRHVGTLAPLQSVRSPSHSRETGASALVLEKAASPPQGGADPGFSHVVREILRILRGTMFPHTEVLSLRAEEAPPHRALEDGGVAAGYSAGNGSISSIPDVPNPQHLLPQS